MKNLYVNEQIVRQHNIWPSRCIRDYVGNAITYLPKPESLQLKKLEIE